MCIGLQGFVADLLISRSAEDWASPALIFTLDRRPSDDDCCITCNMDNIYLSLLTMLKEHLAHSLGRTLVSHTAEGYSVPELES